MTDAAPNVAKRVLVVEDEMLIGMLLEDMLADLGHTVCAVVPRLKDALVAVEKETFDLAILDVHLHGESAFPVADALKTRGIAVRVRDRLWRARPAGELSRTACAAKAVFQGRPRSRAEGRLRLGLTRLRG